MNRKPTLLWLCLLATFPLLGWWATGLLDLDEGFYGAITAEMNRRGEWITPFYNGHPWFEKPILLYWLAKPCLLIFGQAIGPRLPSILATLGLYALVYRFAKRHLAESAEASILILASSLLVVGAGRMMLTDPLLVLCQTAAYLTFWDSLNGQPRARLWTSAALGLGVLAKGPVAGLLFIPVAAITYWRQPELRPAFRGGWLAGTAILLAIVATWYVPAYLANGEMFVQKFLIEQNIGRFSGGDAAHTLGLGSIVLYIPIVALGMIPWSGWLPGAWRERMATPLHRYLWTWALNIFVFFSISGAKLPHYVLPLFPPLAMLVAASMTQRGRVPWTGLKIACIGMGVFANAAFGWWYFVGSGQSQAHELARLARAMKEPVAIYQMGRRQKSRGTGGTKLLETSLPSLSMVLDQDVTDTDDFETVIREGANLILTRRGRFTDEEIREYRLKLLKETESFQLFRLRL